MADEPIKPSRKPSLYKRGAVWYAQITHRDGKRRPYNTHQTGRQDAQFTAADMQIRADRGQPVVEEATGKPATAAKLLTVSALRERWLKDYYKPKIKSMDEWRKDVKKDTNRMLLPYLGDRIAAELRRSDVKDWLAKLRDIYKPGTVILAFSRLQTMYTWAIDEEILNIAHPCRGLDVPRGEPSPHYYTLEQTQQILAEPDCPAMFAAAAYTGMRHGELYALRWEWIDFDKMTIAVKDGGSCGTPKNGKARTVPLHRELLPWLLAWKVKCPATPEGLVFPVFVSTRRSPYGALGVRRGNESDSCITLSGEYHEGLKPYGVVPLPVILARLNIPKATRHYHTARHTFMTYLEFATKSLDVVKQIVGHSRGGRGDVVTLNYIHGGPDMKYLADELAKLSYLPKVEGKGADADEAKGGDVVDLDAERAKRKKRAA